MNNEFDYVVQLIHYSRSKAIKAVNTELINLYWNLGAFINRKIQSANWGEKTVDELARFIQKNHPELKGFNRSSLYRMVQFYQVYSKAKFVVPAVQQIQIIENEDAEIVAPMERQLELTSIRKSLLARISWSHHLIIIARCKTDEEKEFYIRLSIKEKYSKRELDRQINSGIYERVMIGNNQLSQRVKEIHPESINHFKDSYVFEFLNLPNPHNESDLQKGIIQQMKNFILELGRDFLFVGEEYKIQVGNRDFYIDLLFYHRTLQCLVAFELKKEKFEPEHLGKLNFYLEALDRDIKNKSENPSIGILLCKDKDNEVVEYALSRSLSSTMVAEYKTQLPDKTLLQQKLHQLSELGYFGEEN